MKANPPIPLTKGRRRLFTVAMWLLPVLFFVLLDGGLRVVGYGGSYPLFVRVPQAPDYLVLNKDMARRYFVREARVPSGLHDVFLAQKDSAIVRIVVQGGSTAAGYPYYYGGSFSRMLEQRLQQTYFDRRIEIINTAVNSYTMLDQVEEILAQQPDAVLLYAGHNEYYGALGVGSAESLGRLRRVVHAYLDLKKFRVAQGLQALISSAAASRKTESAPTNTLMERMVGEGTIPYGSKLYRQGIRQFRGNLRDLLSRYHSRGIPVFVGTLASNERTHRPFSSAVAPGVDEEGWRAHYHEALALAQRPGMAGRLARHR